MGKTTVLGSERVVVAQPDGSLSIIPACIVVKGGKIDTVVGVEPGGVSAQVKALARKVSGKSQDFGESLISPAFVNPHTHLPMSFFRGFSVKDSTRKNMIEDLFFHVESRLEESDVEAFTRMGAYECLLSGVGFVWDHYYFGRATARGMRSVGLAGVVAPTLQDLAGPGTAWLERQLHETHEIAGDAELHDHGVFAAYGPHATDTVSSDLWKRVLSEAKKTHLPVHVHLAQSKEEYLKVFEREGKSPTQFLRDIGALDDDISALFVHGIYIPRSEIPLLAGKRKVAVFCPFSQLIFQFPAMVQAWEEAGVQWTVATDCVASNDSMNVQKELRYLGGLANMQVTYSPEHGLFMENGGFENAQKVGLARSRAQDLSMHFSDSEFLLKRIWNVPENVHPKCRVGSLSAGALANLIVWDNEHPSMWPAANLRTLAMGDTTQAIANMMVAGEWIGKHGDYHRSILCSSEYAEAKKEASARLEALQTRL